jgi:hypothetical protein
LDPVDGCDHCRRTSEYYTGNRPSVARVPNMAHGTISLARGVHNCHNLFISPDQRLCIVKNMYRPTCIHTSDCVEAVYELPLLPNSTASETFEHKSGRLRSVDWMFLTKIKNSLNSAQTCCCSHIISQSR